VEANSTGGQGSRRAVAPSDDDGHLYHLRSDLKVIHTKLFEFIIDIYIFLYFQNAFCCKLP
jgi:hypothetical protein